MKKVAVISGAAGFLGSAVARRLKDEEYELALIYHSRKPETQGAQYQCDLTDAAQVQKTIDQIVQDFGRIDLCVHAAEPKILRSNLLDLSVGDFKEKLEESVMGTFTLLTACARVMKAQKSGIIIGITTEGIKEDAPVKKMGAYIPAKFAQHGILRELRGELSSSGVRVHELAPGFMAGGLNNDLPKMAFELAEKTWGPLETPEQIAEKVVSLISHDL